MTQRHIAWEHWKNPLGGGEEYSADFSPRAGEDHHYPEYDSDEPEPAPPVRAVVPTAAGLMPLNVYGHLGANFNFWMMHTDFTLSRDLVYGVIKKVRGVETVDTVTRYRARVGFGKCFQSSQVKLNIQKALGAKPLPKPGATGATGATESPPEPLLLPVELEEQVRILKKNAEEHYKHWGIYVVPNGEIILVKSEDAIALLVQCKALAGGILYTSHDSHG